MEKQSEHSIQPELFPGLRSYPDKRTSKKSVPYSEASAYMLKSFPEQRLNFPCS